MEWKRVSAITASLWRHGFHVETRDQLVDVVSALYLEGHTHQRIAEVCGVSKATMVKHLAEYGVVRDGAHQWHKFPDIRKAMHAQYVYVQTQADLDMWCALRRRDGYSLRRLADILQTSYATINLHASHGNTLLMTHSPPPLTPVDEEITISCPPLPVETLVTVQHPKYTIMGTFVTWSVRSQATLLHLMVRGYPCVVIQEKIRLYSAAPLLPVEPATEEDYIFS